MVVSCIASVTSFYKVLVFFWTTVYTFTIQITEKKMDLQRRKVGDLTRTLVYALVRHVKKTRRRVEARLPARLQGVFDLQDPREAFAGSARNSSTVRTSSGRNTSTVRTASGRNVCAVRTSSARNSSTVRTSSVRNSSKVRTISVKNSSTRTVR
jgi:hypothetical protein